MKKESIEKPLIVMSALVCVLVAWHILSLFFPPYMLPSPISVAKRLLRVVIEGDVLEHVPLTVFRVAIGFGLALLIGTSLGVLSAYGKRFSIFLSPIIFMILTIPGMCWVFLAVIWFGLRDITAIFCIFIVPFPMVLINMRTAVENIDPLLEEMADSFGASRFQKLRELVIPSILPYFFAAVRVGFGVGWKVAVIAEVVGATSGVGWIMTWSREIFDMVGVFTWIVVLVIIYVIIEYLIIVQIEKRLLKWRPSRVV